MLELSWVICPAKDCQKLTLFFHEYAATSEYEWQNGVYKALGSKLIHSRKLFPRGVAKPLPDYIPQQIAQDYNEACLILDDSPRAAATLFRRCLQGMIRDFWVIQEKTLYAEIEKAIKQHPETEDFLHPIRQLGNIGAHPENDINIIVPIEPHEAELMKETIEHLIDEWYVNRYKTELRKQKLKQVAADKENLISDVKKPEDA